MASGNIKVNYNSRGVIVLGSHRAGTSTLARSLRALGVYLGEYLIGVRHDNQKGFFEDQIANELDEHLLNQIHCQWKSLVLPVVVDPKVINVFHQNIKNNIFNRFVDNPIWGLKDPRISRLWPYWIPAFFDAGIEAIFVLANRHPFSVANSLAKRDRMPEAHALALWAVHQLDALEALLQHGGLVVDYDLMIENPLHELQRIANFIGRADQLDPDEVSLFVNDFLTDDLRHNRHNSENSGVSAGHSSLQMLSLEIYDELLALAKLPGGLDVENSVHVRTMAAKFREELAQSIDWMQAIDALQTNAKESNPESSRDDLFQSEARLYVSEIVEGVPQTYSESRGAAALFLITSQRQTVRLPMPDDLKPIARIRLDPANLPAALFLHGLALLLADGTEVWRWDGNIGLLKNVGGLVIRDAAEGLLLLSLNDDPQFDLAIPPEVLARVKGGANLVVDFTPRPLLDTLPELLAQEDVARNLPALTQSRTVVPIGMSRQLVEVAQLMKEQIIRRNEAIASQRGEIDSMRGRQQQLEEHILRAEAQLELLKEFFLATGQRSERL
jgi:hypothetical protein